MMMMKLLILIVLCFISTNIIKCQTTNNFNTITVNSINLKDFIGINGDFSLFSSDQVSQQITYVKELDYIGNIRIGIDFDEFEPTEGTFNLDRFDPPMRQINASGLNTIVYFTGVPSWLSSTVGSNQSYPNDNTKFANTLLELAKNYTFVKYWQIWDDANVIPSGSNEYSTQKYNDLFTTVSSVFSASEISSKLLSVSSMYGYGNVIENGVTSETSNMINDLITLNTYNEYSSSFKPFTVTPEGNNGDILSSETGHYQQSKSLISNLKQQGSSPYVYASSWGWSSYDNGVGGSETQQANFTVKRLILDTITGIDKTFISSVSDLNTNSDKPLSDRLYGIVNLQLSKKLIYRVLERLFQITGPTLNVYPTPNNIEFVNSQDGMIFIFYKKPSTSSSTTLIAFYKVSMEGVDNSNVTSVTIKNIDNGGNKGLVGYLYSPIFIQQSYTMVSFNNADNNNSITVPVTYDLQLIEFPLPPPKNNTSSSSSDQVSMSFKLTINNVLSLLILLLTITIIII